MKATLRGIIAFLLLAAGGVVQAQQQAGETGTSLFENFGLVIVFAVVVVMLLVLGIFVRQLVQQAQSKNAQAMTDKVPSVPVIKPTIPAPQAQSTTPYVPLTAEQDDAPAMVLELVKAPVGDKLQEGQQWYISQNRSPFIIGSGTTENQTLDLLLASDFVSNIHLKIEFEAVKQRFVVIDYDSRNGTSFNESKMLAQSRYPIPAAKSALIEVAQQYVFTAIQVKGEPVIDLPEPSVVELNLGEEGGTERVDVISTDSDFVATSKLPDASELMDDMPQKFTTGEVATLHEAPDMSNIAGVRYPLQNVEYPPLARLPENIDAMIEVLRSPQAEAATYTIWRTVYHVGRGDKTDLRVPGAMISNNHFSIYWAKASFWIIDTSLNQTWLRWGEHEAILERGNPMQLEMGQDYQLIMARDDTVLRFRYRLNAPEADASEITLPPLPTAIRPSLTLVRVGTTEERKTFVVSSNRITIGRESSNLVQLDPQVISRRHAEIVWKADAFYIQDKGSLYGVMVDDILLQGGGERRLEAGTNYRIILSPKQRDAVHLEFSYDDRREMGIESGA